MLAMIGYYSYWKYCQLPAFFASDEDITEMRYFKKTLMQICLKGRDGWMKHQEIKH